MSTPSGARQAAAPMECAAWDAAQAAAGQVPEDIGAHLHNGEVMAAHGGRPSGEVQDKTHGAGLPAADRGTL